MHEERRRVAVIGVGHVGLVTAVALAETGCGVACVDIDEGRLRDLARGRVPFYEPGLRDLVAKHLANGALRFTGDYAGALRGAEAAFVTVDTPNGPDGEADLAQVEAVVRGIAGAAPFPEVGRAAPVVALKSTVPVGTGDRVAALLAELGCPLPVVVNPEFLREGTAVRDALNPDRVVVGAEDPAAGDAVASLFESLGAPVVRTDRRTAELIKAASNAFLALKVTLANEVASICEAAGADAGEVLRGVGMDPRIGPEMLRPGLGFGGGCLPKDVLALLRVAAGLGAPSRLLPATLAANGEQPSRLAGRLADVLGGLEGRTVAVLGLAFKPGTDDTRRSPALALCRVLLEAGARVRAYDPAVRTLPDGEAEGIEPADSIEEAASGADAVVVATEWPQFRAVDLGRLRELVRRPLLVDGRQALDPAAVVGEGWTYLGVGRPLLVPQREPARRG